MTGDGSYPVVDFSGGECTFCVACVEACPTGALAAVDPGTSEEQAPGTPRSPWSLKAVIADTCLSIAGITCRVCGEQCPEEAINFRIGLNGKATPIVDREDCTGCGACFGPCPVDAIELRHAALEAAV